MTSDRSVLAAAAVLLLAPLLGAAVPVTALQPPTRPTVQHAIALKIPTYTLSPVERETVAACLVLEAASQGDLGMRGVMAVIRNRAEGHPELFAPTVLKQKQFSSLNRLTSGQETLWRAIQRAKRDRMWPTALKIVDAATEDTWYDPTDGATHYTRRGEHTAWTRSLACTVIIGRHAFYR
ncbi:MAG TPA: cell wall hydrolase [Opitutaceae bacterium]|nr:cell wall hydrolase [Opitutaceae bacterium]